MSYSYLYSLSFSYHINTFVLVAVDYNWYVLRVSYVTQLLISACELTYLTADITRFQFGTKRRYFIYLNLFIAYLLFYRYRYIVIVVVVIVFIWHKIFKYLFCCIKEGNCDSFLFHFASSVYCFVIRIYFSGILRHTKWGYCTETTSMLVLAVAPITDTLP